MQLFVVSNRDRTFYFANNNTRHFAFNADERFLPVYEFADEDMPDGGDIEMSEVSESYSVDVIHPSTGAVVRTLTATSPTVTYTAAQRSTDSYPAGPITFDIYQVSTVVGRGIVKRFTA
jgi:hypothetical protein